MADHIKGDGVTAFANALFGAAHGRARDVGIDFLSVVEETTFVGGVGAGVQEHLSRVVAVQVDIQYQRASLFNQILNLVQSDQALCSALNVTDYNVL